MRKKCGTRSILGRPKTFAHENILSLNISKAPRILQEKGVISLVKTSLHIAESYVKIGLWLLSVMFSISRIRSSCDMDKLIDFAFLNHKGVMAIFQVKSEISKLLKIVNASRPRYILEIGTAGGGTLFLFCRTASENAVISSIDLPGGRYGGGYPTWKIPLYRSFASKHQQINLIRGNSHDEETLAKVKSILNGRKIDFLFIDGDHTYEGVRNDFEMYAPLVRKNRLIALHDIVVHPSESVCGVRKFWDEVKSKYKHEEIVENSEQKWAGIGILHT